MKFSEKLMNLRKGKGWSQDEFAQKLNITRQTVSKWELDQTVPDMNKLIEISKLFEISLDELVNGIEESNSDSTYKESAREKNNRKIAIKIFVVGIIISCIIMGIGLIRQKQANKNNEEAYKKAYELTEEKVKNARIRISEIANEMEKLNNQIDEKNKEISSLKKEVSDLTNEKSKIFTEDKIFSERYYSKVKIANEKNNEIDTKNQELLNLKNKYSSLNMEVISLKNGNYNVYYNTVDPMKYLLFYYIGAGIAGVSILIALIYFLITRKK